MSEGVQGAAWSANKRALIRWKLWATTQTVLTEAAKHRDKQRRTYGRLLCRQLCAELSKELLRRWGAQCLDL